MNGAGRTVRVTVIGSGTGIPDPRRAETAVLVKGNRESILLEAGASTLRRISAAGVDPRDLNAILVSHLHLDHAGGLPLWLFALTIPEYSRRKPLILGGGEGLTEHLAALGGVYGRHVAPPCGVTLVDLRHEKLPLEEFEVAAFPTAHMPGSIGFRITVRDGGPVVAYSGDTGECPGLLELGKEADLFILECSHPDGSPHPGHLTPGQAVQIARQSRCREALLVHLYPGWDPREAVSSLLAERSTPPRVRVAEDGLSIELRARPQSSDNGALGAGPG